MMATKAGLVFLKLLEDRRHLDIASNGIVPAGQNICKSHLNLRSTSRRDGIFIADTRSLQEFFEFLFLQLLPVFHPRPA